jgi:hypothetical protein
MGRDKVVALQAARRRQVGIFEAAVLKRKSAFVHGVYFTVHFCMPTE